MDQFSDQLPNRLLANVWGADASGFGALMGFNRKSNRVYPYGDSRKAQSFANAPINTNKSGYNHINWANALSGQRMIIVGNGGVSGERSDQIRARLPAALASNAGTILLQAGLNDAGQAQGGSFIDVINGKTITPATCAANVIEHVTFMLTELLTRLGADVILFLDPGAGSLSSVGIGIINAINAGYRALAQSLPRVHLVDLPAIQRDRAATTSGAIAFKAGFMRNWPAATDVATHEATIGAAATGAALAEVVKRVIPPLPIYQIDASDQPGTSLTQLLSNPIFAGGTNGTIGAGASGVVPASFTLQRLSGTGTIVSAISDRGDGEGKELVLTLDGKANDSFFLSGEVNANNWSQGDLLQAAVEIVTDARGDGVSPLSGVWLEMQARGDAVTTTTMDLYCDLTHGAWPAGRQELLLATQQFRIPQYTNKGYVALFLRIQFLSDTPAEKVTIRVRSMQVKKIPA